MSDAIKCDCCGSLCEKAGTVQIETVLLRCAEDEMEDWSNIDVCPACMEKPFKEVLAAGCQEFEQLRATALAAGDSHG